MARTWVGPVSTGPDNKPEDDIMKHQRVVKPKCRHDCDLLSVASRPVIISACLWDISSAVPLKHLYILKSAWKNLWWSTLLNPENRTLTEALDTLCISQLCIGKPFAAVIPAKREKKHPLWQEVLAQLHWAEQPSYTQPPVLLGSGHAQKPFCQYQCFPSAAIVHRAQLTAGATFLYHRAPVKTKERTIYNCFQRE